MEAHIASAAYLARTSEGGRWAKGALTPCGHSRTALVRTQIAEIATVNAPARLGSTPRLEDFPYRLTDNVRFADLDPNQHVNNAVYATYFETGRVTLMKDPSYALTPEGLAWILVRLDIHFRGELRWPGAIEMGIGVAKFGRTSVTFDQVVFSKGACVASAQAVTVLIGETSRKPTPLTPEIIAKFQPWLRGRA
jgi:acyl-CoA thioester hydrolase